MSTVLINTLVCQKRQGKSYQSGDGHNTKMILVNKDGQKKLNLDLNQENLYKTFTRNNDIRTENS